MFLKKYSIYGIDTSNTNSVYRNVIQEIKSHSNVLEIGCYDGDTGAVLCTEKECNVVGVDNDSDALFKAGNRGVYTELINIDLNESLPGQFPFERNSFDYITLCDVLEHLYSPDNVLKYLQIFVKNNGKIIISVPNISHGGIKLNLLQDTFQYTENGLLDYTHIRFFTLDNLLNLLFNTGLEVIRFERIYAPIDKTEQNVDLKTFPRGVVRYVERQPESYTYQYFVVCVVASEKNENLFKKNYKKSKFNLLALEKFKEKTRKYSVVSHLLKVLFKRLK